VPLGLFWDGEPSSVFCSAAMSSSRSALYSGEGVASSGSGEAMISPRRRAALGLARMLWWAAAGTGDARLVCVQPSVFALGMGPAQRRSQCVSCARLLAFQRRVLECDHACAGYSNGCCRGTLTAPMTETTGGAGRRLAVNPARRYGTILLWYRAGVGAIEGAFQEHTESWLIADATETRRPCCWSRAVLRKRSPGRRDGGGRDGWGVASRQGRRDAAAVGRRCGTALGGGRAVLKLLAGEATRGRRDGRGRCGGSASWWAMGAAAALERRGGGAAGEVSTLGCRMRCDCDVTCWRCAHTMQSPHWPSKFADWKSGSCRLDLGPGAGTAWRLA
jgi:hypothetical protein